MKVANLDPIMVSTEYQDCTITWVLIPQFDEELINYIKDNNLKVGDIIKPNDEQNNITKTSINSRG